ncbi:metal dependent phosphohydrolase [Thermovibrio ammonificans HB-1]|uniref:Metal dependent phosphohydrolase n=1 Tax=Thermovibrio ammonificans (strain DSM 15698 / JCM 12110 / HB-1) TaxID=648996 RepID=E8T520_THEA1|nr:HD-GYP domain-containing protein [Thermovibrio ammonificans]ADU97552.1 metal dependent phosphohydrolase [Thermovibrio ammonificans HB-1]
MVSRLLYRDIKNFNYSGTLSDLEAFLNSDSRLVGVEVYTFMQTYPVAKLFKSDVRHLPRCSKDLFKEPCIYVEEATLAKDPPTRLVLYFSNRALLSTYRIFQAVLLMFDIYLFIATVLFLWASYSGIKKRIESIVQLLSNPLELQKKFDKKKKDEFLEIEKKIYKLYKAIRKEFNFNFKLLTLSSELLYYLVKAEALEDFISTVNSLFKMRNIAVKVAKTPQCPKGFTSRRLSHSGFYVCHRKIPSRFLETILNIIDTVLLAAKEKEKNRRVLLQTIEAFAKAIDAMSPWTRGHSSRVAAVAEFIGRKLELSEKELENLKIGALLHDIGKLGVPVSILDKNGKLTDEEYEIIKKHPEIGYRILEPIETFKEILPIVLYHHERCNGSGYPKGLKCEEIPKLAKIVAVADVIEAMTAKRPYKEPHPFEEVLKHLKENSGKLYDPKIVKVVEENAQELKELLERIREDEESQPAERGDRQDRQRASDPTQQKGQTCPRSGGD